MRAQKATDRINAVVLLTDGEDTDSQQNADDVIAHLEGQGDSDEPRARVHDRLLARAPRARAASSSGSPRRRAAWTTRARRRTSSPSTARISSLLLVPAPAPYDRARYNRALIANALLDPFNVVLLAVVLIVGILLGIFAYALPIGRRCCTWRARRGRTSTRTRRTRCSRASGPRIASRSRRGGRRSSRRTSRRRSRGCCGRRGCASGASATRSRAPTCPTRRSPRRSTASCAAMDSTAARAQLLYEALADTPPDGVEARLGGGAARAAGEPELEEALSHAAHDAAADGEAARALLLRDGADPGRARHGALAARVGVGVVGVGQQTELAADVRALRERVGASAEGMAAAFEA